MRILKFPLEPFDLTTVYTKGELNVLSVGVDGKNRPCVWVEAEEGSTTKTVFEVVLTGQDVPQETPNHLKGYKGTIFLKTWEADLPLYVMHIYEWYPKWTEKQWKEWSQITIPMSS